MNYKRKKRFCSKRINHAPNAPPPNRSGGQGRRPELPGPAQVGERQADSVQVEASTPQPARTRSTTLTDSVRRGAAAIERGREDSEDRSDRPKGGNLPLAEAGRWQCPRRRRRASSWWGVEERRGIEGPNGIKSPAAPAALGTASMEIHAAGLCRIGTAMGLAGCAGCVARSH